METALAGAAIQVAGIFVVGYIFLNVLKLVLNQQGERAREREERIIVGMEKLRDAVLERRQDG